MIVELKKQVAEAGRRITKSHIQNVFEQHANGVGSCRGIERSRFKAALCAVRQEFQFLSEEDVEQRFSDSDVENNRILSETEFTYALEMTLPLEQVLSTLPLHRMVESALPGFHTRNPADHVDIFSSLSDREISCMVQAIVPSLKRILCDTAHSLKLAIFQQQSGGSGSGDLGSKFSITLNGGSVDNFHAGLSGRVGGEILNWTTLALYATTLTYCR